MDDARPRPPYVRQTKILGILFVGRRFVVSGSCVPNSLVDDFFLTKSERGRSFDVVDAQFFRKGWNDCLFPSSMSSNYFYMEQKRDGHQLMTGKLGPQGIFPVWALFQEKYFQCFSLQQEKPLCCEVENDFIVHLEGFTGTGNRNRCSKPLAALPTRLMCVFVFGPWEEDGAPGGNRTQ